MATWFKVKIFLVEDDFKGIPQNVVKVLLLDAISWTDAETRVYVELEKEGIVDFKIETITKTKISDIHPYSSGELWVEFEVEAILFDEISGKEKRGKIHHLVMANSIEQSLSRIKETQWEFGGEYLICSISISDINEVYPYFDKEEQARTTEQLSKEMETLIQRKYY